MKATGMVRRVDPLGRLSIPKELRTTLQFNNGDPIEMFLDQAGRIILKKYNPEENSAKIHFKNQTEYTLSFCCGMKEYVAKPEEELTILVDDEDCMYLDMVVVGEVLD